MALDPADGEQDARWARRDGPLLEEEGTTQTVPEAALQAGAPVDDDGARVVERAPWWVWPLVGAGMALAIGGTVFGVQQAMDQPVGTR